MGFFLFATAAAAQDEVHWPAATLRGANIVISTKMTPRENPIGTADIDYFVDEWKGNVIRLNNNEVLESTPPYRVDPTFLDGLSLIDHALKRGLYVVLGTTTGWDENDAFFRSPERRAAYKKYWETVAARYKDYPGGIAYDIMNEPHDDAAKTEWSGYARELTAAIRKIDTRHTIIVEPPEWGSPEGFAFLEPTGDSNTVYSFHFYSPHDFTHQRHNGTLKATREDWKKLVYPGFLQGEEWDAGTIARKMQPAFDWSARHHALLWCGEFGTARWGIGAIRWFSDVADLLESRGVGWAYYSYREWYPMDLEMDPNAWMTTSPRSETDFVKLLRGYYRNNGAVRWLNPVDAPQLAVEGLPWFGRYKIFRRLPPDPAGKEFSKDVNSLADNTAGAQIRFRTNSRFVKVRARLTFKSFMYHMPSTGQSGIDIYDESDGRPRFCGVTRLSPEAAQYEADGCDWGADGWRDVTLDLPLYNGIESLEIGISTAAAVEPPRTHRRPGRVVVYGTSITQGGVASRPGLGWTTQLGRTLDQEVVNLGFSGSGLGEPALARRIAEIDDVRMILLDYEANAQQGVRETLAPFIKVLRDRHPKTPIVVISQIPWIWERWSKSYSKDRSDLREFQRKTVEDLRAKGDGRIYFINGYDLMPRERFEEGLVDGVHPNDVGMTWIAEGIARRVKQLGL